jgi:transglutaminase-like putative cysteine protease
MLAHSFMLSVGLVVVSFLSFPYGDPRVVDWMGKLGNTVTRIVRWLETAFAGRPQEDKLVILIFLGLSVWLVGYFSTWFVFRRHWVWLAVTLNATAIIVNISYSPPNARLAFVIWILASLVVVVRMSYFKNEERWKQLRFRYRPGLVLNSLLVGIILASLVTGLAFAAPSSSQSPQIQAVIDQITSPFEDLRDNLFGSAPNSGKEVRQGRSSAGYQAFGKSFTIGGPLNLSNDPILQVRGNDPTYLQAAVMDKYDGKGWIATYQDAPLENEIVFPQLSLAPNQTLPTSPDKGRVNNQLKITMLQNNIPTLFMGGEPVSIDRLSLLAFHWEPVVIKANLDEIQVKQVGTGADGRPRNLLVDTTTNKPIPPDLLPLVRLLKQSQEQLSEQNLPVLQFTYTRTNNVWSLSVSGKSIQNVNVVPNPRDGTYTANIDSKWSLNSPAANVVQNNTNYAQLRFTYRRANNQNSVGTLKIQSIQKETNKIVVNTLPTSEYTRSTFEQTPTGKEIKTELDRLVKQIPNVPAKADYTFEEGVPGALSYEGYQPNYDDLLVVSAAQVPKSGENYSTTGLRYTGDISSLRQADNKYPDWVRGRYLQLPNAVPNRVRSLARQVADTNPIVYDISRPVLSPFAGPRTNYDKAKAIETYLRTLKYNERTGFVPDGRDAVDYFLYDSKEGYCVHFATSMVVMLRANAIPSRLVTGLVGGEYDASTGATTIRGTASHAWVQAYFPGYGWVNFEPTPAYGAINRPADPASVPPVPSPTPAVVSAPAVPTPEPENPQVPNQTPNPNTVAGNSTDNNLLIWLAIMLGLVGLGLVIWQGNAAWVRNQLQLSDVSPQIVYQRLNRAAKGARLLPREQLTPNEYARFLSTNLAGTEKAVETLTANYVRDRYGPPFTESDKPAEEDVRQHWQKVMGSLITFRRKRRLKQLTPKFLHKWLKIA